jgi:hypothetical protein
MSLFEDLRDIRNEGSLRSESDVRGMAKNWEADGREKVIIRS